MKKFNLLEAKEGKPVCNGLGESVRIVCFDMECIDHKPLIGLRRRDQSEILNRYDINGNFDSDSVCANSLALHMAPAHHEVWVNVYPYKLCPFVQMGDAKFKSKELAILGKKEGYLATVKVEWDD